jgi:hypothetical protein
LLFPDQNQIIKIMKRIITFNWRPLCRGLYALLIGITALWAMPKSAHAQVLFVSQVGSGANTGTVSQYNATTGALINPNFITGVNDAGAILLSGNTLYVADASAFGPVGAYNATTGAAINTTLIKGLGAPAGLLVSGNTLYVANRDPSTVQTRVGSYNAATGAVINATLITGLGLDSNPAGLALSGNNLLVADSFDHVGEYNAMTGAAINASFITMPGVGALLLSGNTLYAASASNGGLISEYNATTGVAINTNFIVNGGGNVGLALSGNDLFVSRSNATVNEYNATTGALITANFIPPLATVTDANGIAVAPIPEPSTWSMMAVGGVALLGMMHRKKHRIA